MSNAIIIFCRDPISESFFRRLKLQNPKGLAVDIFVYHDTQLRSYEDPEERHGFEKMITDVLNNMFSDRDISLVVGSHELHEVLSALPEFRNVLRNAMSNVNHGNGIARYVLNLTVMPEEMKKDICGWFYAEYDPIFNGRPVFDINEPDVIKAFETFVQSYSVTE